MQGEHPEFHRSIHAPDFAGSSGWQQGSTRTCPPMCGWGSFRRHWAVCIVPLLRAERGIGCCARAPPHISAVHRGHDLCRSLGAARGRILHRLPQRARRLTDPRRGLVPSLGPGWALSLCRHSHTARYLFYCAAPYSCKGWGGRQFLSISEEGVRISASPPAAARSHVPPVAPNDDFFVFQTA